MFEIVDINCGNIIRNTTNHYQKKQLLVLRDEAAQKQLLVLRDEAAQPLLREK